MRLVSATFVAATLLVLSQRDLADGLSDPLAATVDQGPMVTCPAGQLGLISERELQAKLAPYDFDGAKLDPPPVGQMPPVFPAIPAYKFAQKDSEFPRTGSARAILLEHEDGTVAEVIVACASSQKYVAPIVEGLSRAKLNAAKSNGKPVKHVVVVPLTINLDS